MDGRTRTTQPRTARTQHRSRRVRGHGTHVPSDRSLRHVFRAGVGNGERAHRRALVQRPDHHQPLRALGHRVPEFRLAAGGGRSHRDVLQGARAGRRVPQAGSRRSVSDRALRRSQTRCRTLQAGGTARRADRPDAFRLHAVEPGRLRALREYRLGVHRRSGTWKKFRHLSLRDQGPSSPRHQPRRGSRRVAGVHEGQGARRKLGEGVDCARPGSGDLGCFELQTQSRQGRRTRGRLGDPGASLACCTQRNQRASGARQLRDGHRGRSAARSGHAAGGPLRRDVRLHGCSQGGELLDERHRRHTPAQSVVRQPVHWRHARLSDCTSRTDGPRGHEAFCPQHQDAAYAGGGHGTVLREHQKTKARRGSRDWQAHRTDCRHRQSHRRGR